MTHPASLTLSLPDIEATDRLAHALSSIADPGCCILLDGPVGAGKTYLARKILHILMRAQGQIEDVPSPTFTLVQTYQIGALEVWHADLYRLTSADELVELGLEAAFETAFCLVEWPDRMGDMAPAKALHIALSPDIEHDDRRTAVVTGPPTLLAHLQDLREGVA